jgi:formylglycine-generating enzyme required for sulfatase activity
MKTARITVALLLACMGSASATIPEIPLETLCRNGTLVFGTVLGGHAHDCRLHAMDASCWGRGVVGVNVRIDETVPPSRENIRPGDVIQIAIRTHNDLPRDAGPEAAAADKSVPGMLGLPGTGKAVTDVDAGKLTGTEFAFALTRRDYRDKNIPEPYFAAAYPVTNESWVRVEWASEACGKLRQETP